MIVCDVMPYMMMSILMICENEFVPITVGAQAAGASGIRPDLGGRPGRAASAREADASEKGTGRPPNLR